MKHCLLCGGTILLAACGSQPEFSQGMWTMEVSLAAAEGELWSSKTERCIDPAAGDPVTGMLSMTPLGACQAGQSESSGDRLYVTANCMGRPDAMMGGMPQTRISVGGSRSAISIDAVIEAELAMEPQSPKLTGKLVARRIGDC
jgi:hypothetical protein